MVGRRLLILVSVTVFLAGGITLASAKDSKKGQSKTLRVKAGKEFTVTLKSNITTGYQWQLSKAVDKHFLLLVGLRYVNKNKGKLVGSGGKEEWTFKAVKPGTAVVSFEYVRPWEKDATAAKTRNFIVIIK